MTRFFITGFIAIFLTACGQNNNQTSGRDLIQTENDWMHAMMKKDRSVLDQLVAPEFTQTGMKYIDSADMTRSVWMQDVMHNLKIDSVQFLKVKTNTTAEVGIVRAQFYWSGTYDTTKFADTISFVDTWVKRNGDLRVVSRVITD